jgi:hypothetical protein
LLPSVISLLLNSGFYRALGVHLRLDAYRSDRPIRAMLIAVFVVVLAAIAARPALAAAETMPTCAERYAPDCLIAAHPPIPGFDPIYATGPELEANGFPQRPPADEPQALAQWERAVSAATSYSNPDPVQGSMQHATSLNWAGHVVSNSLHGGVHFTTSAAFWTQPAVPADGQYTNYNDAPDASFWDGIGASYLIQAGADSISTQQAQYKFWTEDYPANTVWEGPAIRPGDEAYSSVTYNGNNTAFYFLEDVTTGSYQSFTNSAPYVGYSAANFINERVGSHFLPNFGSAYFHAAQYGVSGGSIWTLTTSNTRYDMYTAGGTLESSGGSVDDLHAAFTVTWHAP